MKFLKTTSASIIAICLLFTLNSCSKGKDDAAKPVTKDQLAGKWTMTIQSNSIVTLHATLKANGAMELDEPPFDNVTDIILLWDVTNGKFTAHLDANNIPNYWKLEGTIDPKLTSVTGTLTADNSPNPPQVATFILDKQ